MSDDAGRAWKDWHEHRVDTVSAPYGPLALTATHWLADYPDGRIPAVPGRWQETDGRVRLTATEADGLTLDGAPFAGTARLDPDHAPPAGARVAAGPLHLVVVRREGAVAVRVFDPDSPARRAFRGIEVTPYDPALVLPGRFRPYGEQRTVRVETADGQVRGLGLDGELVFDRAGTEHRLHVAADGESGALWAVFADVTSSLTSYRFRFLKPGPPHRDGRVTVDLNRAELPPCAFAEHFICPFPPPGNTLPFEVTAGERRLKAALAPPF
ncbi:DUF1684 domain-containing protein [Streptomyces bambusae]|uniref:DUF1684 domain-containing protein n=1 Tax=Streptomyces bambusae TaxID=1550616 RepID=A0ABS6ZCA7_9ACTN|nr:DUF1684 domain-containing protein [Streptomyces bambusae]MBW5485400.1 DUF1684 domain-containing protein [Streptomyces bambusae]